MKKINISLIIVCLLFMANKSIFSQITDMSISGVYQGRDLFIYNPTTSSDTTPLGQEEYCIKEILINNVLYEDQINSNSILLALTNFNWNYGDNYTITIKHQQGCTPQVVNREVTEPMSTFNITSHKVENNNLIFTTSKESGKLNFIVEEYRWEKWHKIGEIQGLGGPEDREYSLAITPFIGENKFRISQVDVYSKKNISETLVANVTGDAIIINTNLKKVKSNITFSGTTKYLVVNKFGEIKNSGTGSEVNVTDLKKGEYFIMYENQYSIFVKK